MRAPLTSVHGTSAARTGVTRLALVLLVLAALTLFGAIAARRPELVALAVPFLLPLVFAFVGFRDDTFAVHLEFDADDHHVEGDITELRVVIESSAGVRRCEVEVELPPGVTPASPSMRAIVTVSPGVPRVVEFPVELTDWGVITPRALSVRATDELGLLARDYRFTTDASMRVRLHAERLQSLLTPDRYLRVVGSHPSGDRGDGTELADVREYRTGDPMKWINWRISNRRQEPWVTVRHPDRATTIVILVDGNTIGGAKERAQARMAEALAKSHLDVHDRVGLLVAGSNPIWIEPQLGRRQLHRISDALLDTTNPRLTTERFDAGRVIPADAVIIGVSTLDNPRIIETLAGLRSRGRMLSVIEPTFPDMPLHSTLAIGLHTEPLARRMYRLQREVGRRQFRARGLVVVPWSSDDPIETPIATLARRTRGGR